MSWPDIEKALVSHLRDSVSARVATKIPGDVETIPRFVRVVRGPGSDDGITDSPLVDVETFTPAYADAYALANEVREALQKLTGKRVGNALVDSVRTSVAPAWVDYRNPDTNRFVASYRIEFRKNYT